MKNYLQSLNTRAVVRLMLLMRISAQLLNGSSLQIWSLVYHIDYLVVYFLILDPFMICLRCMLDTSGLALSFSSLMPGAADYWVLLL